MLTFYMYCVIKSVFLIQQVKQPNMTLYCTCGGRFKTLHKRDDFSHKLRIFKKIASYFSMPLLKETVEWIISNNLWIKQ